MRKLRFEISIPAIQATAVCLATVMLVCVLMWIYVGDHGHAVSAGELQNKAAGSDSEDHVALKTGSDKAGNQQVADDLPGEITSDSGAIKSRSGDTGVNPSKLVGPLATDLANLVGRIHGKVPEPESKRR